MSGCAQVQSLVPRSTLQRSEPCALGTTNRELKSPLGEVGGRTTRCETGRARVWTLWERSFISSAYSEGPLKVLRKKEHQVCILEG